MASNQALAMDPKTVFKLSQLCPDVAQRWKDAAFELQKNGLFIRVTDGYRTFADQWAEWGKGRLKDKNGEWVICDRRKVVTYAKPGFSLHNYGLALDSCFHGDDPYWEKLWKSGPEGKAESSKRWKALGDAVKAQGMVWGGDWFGIKHDQPHAEMTYGLSIHSIQMAYEELGLKGLWDKCKNALLCGAELV